MAHHIYQTEGIVLESRAIGEAHRYLSIFTRDFGYLSALARSVREERSKLRFGLQNHSYASLSLVRGRDFWRAVGALPRDNIYFALKDTRDKAMLYFRLVSLLRQLLHGEEKNEELFTVFLDGLSFLKREELAGDDLRNTECIIVLRVLYTLGYVPSENFLKAYLTASSLSRDLVAEVRTHRPNIIAAINESLQASHL
jgi:DNA repair protein RecO (recombination protein O)